MIVQRDYYADESASANSGGQTDFNAGGTHFFQGSIPPELHGPIEIVWTAQRGGVTATLDPNGNVGFSRKIEPGERASADGLPPPQALAAARELAAEARDYAYAHLVTMPRAQYEAAQTAEAEKAAQRSLDHEASLRVAREAEGLSESQAGATRAVEGEMVAQIASSSARPFAYELR